MSTILVTYYSRTGKTEELAREVGEGVTEGGGELVLKKVEAVEVRELLDYAGMIIGSPTYYGLPSAEIKRLFDDSVQFHGKLTGKVGGAFATSANLAGGNETTLMAILQAMLVHGMIIQGTAQGDHYGPVSTGKLDKRATTHARELGRRVAELAARLEL